AVSAVNFSVMNSQAVLLAIDGEGGVGKSRLIEELLESITTATPGAFVVRGSAVPYGQANRWWPLASALIDELELEPTTPPDTVREFATLKGRS
ncbi:MAG TPA: AAA family ATPase, partial [Ilumatobacteraceae bacterium]|nr:AAA family ATPase [Ilumatobacteraceae bacterium]